MFAAEYSTLDYLEQATVQSELPSLCIDYCPQEKSKLEGVVVVVTVSTCYRYLSTRATKCLFQKHSILKLDTSNVQ
jgi:hypothetical protein